MNVFEKIVYFLQKEMETPTNYGWFHLMFFALVILTTFLLIKFFRNCNDKTFRRIALISWIIMVLFEIYKQIVFAFNYNNGDCYWDYAWYAFPYQLCSTPLYALPFIVFLKNDKIRDAFICYMSTFSLFGGVAVFFYPNDVFIRYIGINIQTMVHHGLQIVLGIFFAVHNHKKLCNMYYIKSLVLFSVFSLIAIVLNISMYHIFQGLNMDDTFNMFFISPYFDCTLPVLSLIYPKVPYPVFLCLYLFGFALIGYLLYLAQVGIKKLIGAKKNAKV